MLVMLCMCVEMIAPTKKEPCKICEGTGMITFNGTTFCCPQCHTSKFTHTKRVIKFTPEERTISKVIVSESINKIYRFTHVMKQNRIAIE